MSDHHKELIKQIAAKNEQAMSEFYDCFHSIVYHFALKKIREPADAAEVLNQVMLEVWRSAKRYEGRSKVQTWVLSITNHKAIDKLRKLERHKTEDMPEDLESEEQYSQIDLISLTENAELIRYCLDKLSDQHKEIIHLAFYEDMIYSEIAKVIERPEGTVKTRMFHAKNALKKCLTRVLNRNSTK